MFRDSVSKEEEKHEKRRNTMRERIRRALAVLTLSVMMVTLLAGAAMAQNELTCGDRDDYPFCYGTSVSDRMFGTNYVDIFFAYGGNDIILPGAGTDVVYAGPGNDIVYSSPDNDGVRGSYGGDNIEDFQGVDRIWGEQDSDIIEVNDRTGGDYVDAGESIGDEDRVCADIGDTVVNAELITRGGQEDCDRLLSQS
jgi:hypothetical protein